MVREQHHNWFTWLLTFHAVTVLLINAIAILSEDRFLARSMSTPYTRRYKYPLPLLSLTTVQTLLDIGVPQHHHGKYHWLNNTDMILQLAGLLVPQSLALGNETMRA